MSIPLVLTTSRSDTYVPSSPSRRFAGNNIGTGDASTSSAESPLEQPLDEFGAILARPPQATE